MLNKGLMTSDKNYKDIRFLKGRLKFELNGEAKQSAPFPSAVVIY